ncbi:hypothetical protein HMPREF9141_0147 [Prevotella multiformis DSM 16608]|uniref:Uncharacterized protein n=1 Tax=Prevotella multiformis DSM 16608 TaxID=888743 RepID=F0F3I1_9BACT|nr:hypothetical protein HMPREF9141_0147 [Prevotella multiformis DSM 16608]
MPVGKTGRQASLLEKTTKRAMGTEAWCRFLLLVLCVACFRERAGGGG